MIICQCLDNPAKRIFIHLNCFLNFSFPLATDKPEIVLITHPFLCLRAEPQRHESFFAKEAGVATQNKIFFHFKTLSSMKKYVEVLSFVC